ncbi:unnamed protein product, partial [Symbiodinium microadriaticum]
ANRIVCSYDAHFEGSETQIDVQFRLKELATLFRFPNTYASKVGKTSDGMYKDPKGNPVVEFLDTFQQSRVFACWWPRICAAALYCCILLVTHSAVVGMLGKGEIRQTRAGCPLAQNVWRAPPQYQSFDDANPFPRECPPADYSDNSLDGPEDPRLYDDNAAGTRQSVLGHEQEILRSGSAAAALSGGAGGQPTMASRNGFRKPPGSGAIVAGRQDDGAGLSADTTDAEEVDMQEVESGLEESGDGAAAGPSSHAGELPVVKV